MIFGENRKKEQNGKLGKIGPFPRRGRKATKTSPWVRYDVALLRRSEALRHGEGTVHTGQKFDFVFKSLVFVHR